MTDETAVSILPKEFSSGVVIQAVTAEEFTLTGINLSVKFKHTGDEAVMFHAVPYDTEAHGKWLYEEAKKGTFGTPGPYVQPAPSIQELQEELNELMTDITLGLATPEELARAKTLRLQIKSMMAA